MIRILSLFLFIFIAGKALSQEAQNPDFRAGTSPRPSASPSPAKEAGKPKAPTEITCMKEATYDEKSRKAVFIGEVHVKDPQFTINCDKLTAFLRKEAVEADAGSPSKSPSPAPAGSPEKSPGPEAKRGGLQSAIAEGHVVIIQEKPAASGGKPERNVGKGERADYNADSGDVVLTGWPQVSQGLNTQVATSAETVMTMNRDGKTMKTTGPSRLLIQEQGPDETEKKTSH